MYLLAACWQVFEQIDTTSAMHQHSCADDQSPPASPLLSPTSPSSEPSLPAPMPAIRVGCSTRRTVLLSQQQEQQSPSPADVLISPITGKAYRLLYNFNPMPNNGKVRHDSPSMPHPLVVGP